MWSHLEFILQLATKLFFSPLHVFTVDLKYSLLEIGVISFFNFFLPVGPWLILMLVPLVQWVELNWINWLLSNLGISWMQLVNKKKSLVHDMIWTVEIRPEMCEMTLRVEWTVHIVSTWCASLMICLKKCLLICNRRNPIFDYAWTGYVEN